MGYGNANNWLYTSTLLLQNHYEDILKEARDQLRVIPKERWQEVWEVAVGWAHKNLKTIHPLTIRLAKEEIRGLMADERVSGSGPQREEERMEVQQQEAGLNLSRVPGESTKIGTQGEGEAEAVLVPRTGRMQKGGQGEGQQYLDVGAQGEQEKQPHDQGWEPWPDLENSPLWFQVLEVVGGEGEGKGVQDGARKEGGGVEGTGGVRPKQQQPLPACISGTSTGGIRPGIGCWPQRRSVVVIVGDSNMGRLPLIGRGDLEINNFPGANFPGPLY
ncbi:MAG: hypothetical protein ACRDC4_09030 [Plesiomonas sp.]